MYWRTFSTRCSHASPCVRPACPSPRWKWRRASWNIGSVRFADASRAASSASSGASSSSAYARKNVTVPKLELLPPDPITTIDPTLSQARRRSTTITLTPTRRRRRRKNSCGVLDAPYVRELLAVGTPDDRVLDFDVSVGVVHVDLIFDRGGTVGVSFALLEESKRLPEHR